MNTDHLNRVLDDFVRSRCSPLEAERERIEERYQRLKNLLRGLTFRSGSYARYTAVTPVHDLDVINEYTELDFANVPHVMRQLARTLQQHYRGEATVTAQEHSVRIMFQDKFSIDVVPGLRLAQRNAYGQPLYLVPEIQKMSHRERQALYASGHLLPNTKLSDPRGYREQAQKLNDANSDFRKAAKFIKKWRQGCKEVYDDRFALKAFHSELIVTAYFLSHPGCTALAAATAFFASLPQQVQRPAIPDLADPAVYVDAYLHTLTPAQRQLIHSETALAAQKLTAFCRSGQPDHLLDICRLRAAAPQPGGYATRPQGLWLP